MTWKSVKDELPDDMRRVLTCYTFNEVQREYLLNSYIGPYWFYKDGDVTHWAELPSMPAKAVRR